MASIEKAGDASAQYWLQHNDRCKDKDKNIDIDPDRSHENYSLTPGLNIPKEEQYERRIEVAKYEYERYKALKDQFYCMNRKDVKTMVSVIVTLPREIKDPETEEKFFRGVADFLSDRYKNTVSITVHKDEGKHFVLKDASGNTILDKDGNPKLEWHAGQPHLHYTFIPTVSISHAKLDHMKNPIKAMYDYREKISAKERVNRQDLKTLHPDMHAYINNVCGIKCNLMSGITKAQGGNKTVDQLKKDFDEKVIQELATENKRLNRELAVLKKNNVELTRENMELKKGHNINKEWGNHNWNRNVGEDLIWQRK